MSSFNQFKLDPRILKALDDLGFKQPTEIQEKAFPVLVNGYHDFVGLAQTGTGKTAAFSLPLLSHVEAEIPVIQALILSPTRELCRQITEQLYLYTKYLPGIKTVAIYGGEPITRQLKALKNKKPQIIVATPGRLIDMINRRAIKLDDLGILVLDEADEMLNMGFKEELDNILEFTPEEKFVWLFSATMPNDIRKISEKYMENPHVIEVSSGNEVNSNITHSYALIKAKSKSKALTRFIDSTEDMRGIVFCRTKRETQELAELLIRKNYKSDALHGDLSQKARDKVMENFRKHNVNMLIATDVAARGIDVSDLTHVFHFNLPDDLAYYTHRSGRTARAGKTGSSISLISNKEVYKIHRLEKKLSINFSLIKVPGAEDIIRQRATNWAIELLNTSGKSNIPADVLENIQTIFGTLTKEELVAKLVTKELNSLTNSGQDDLNDQPRSDRKSYSDKGRKKGGRSRGKGGYKYGKSSDKYKPSGKKKKKDKKKKYFSKNF